MLFDGVVMTMTRLKNAGLNQPETVRHPQTGH
jgi:hypothetical protein